MKKISYLSLLIILLVGAKSYAQFSHIWNASFHFTHTPNFSSESRKMVQDASGNIFIMVDATSDGATAGVTYHYVTILKYSSTGNILARMDQLINNHVVSGFDNFSAFGLEVDGTGNVYAGYALYSAANNFNIKIVKFDNNLIRIWTNTYGGAGVETGVDMKLSSSGTVYALLKSVVSGNTYYKVVKTINMDGNAAIVYASNANNDVLRSIAVDNSQNVYVAGSRTAGGYRSVLLVSINSTTNAIRFASTYNGGLNGDDYANMVTVGVDGNIYVIGTSNQGGGHGSDQVVLKHTSAVSQFWVWTRLQQNSSSDEGIFISAAESGFLYTAMTSNKKVRIMRLNSTTGEITVPGAADNYEPLPASPYTSITGITLNDMKVSSNKNIYVTGSVLATNNSGQAFSAYYLERFNFNTTGGTFVPGFNQPVTGTFTDNYKGVALSLVNSSTSVLWLRDYWSTNSTHAVEDVQIYGMDVPSTLREDASVSNISLSENTVSMYPNPARNFVKIVSAVPVYKVEIYDVIGNKVAEKNEIDADGMINISELKHGIYVCRLNSETGVLTKKLIIE